MENMLIYFAKVNGLLILFYFVYVLFLRKETFFTSNRWYLILGLLLSVALPFITFTKTIFIEPEPIVYATELPVLKPTFEPIVVEEASFDWSLVFLVFYSAIATLFFIKILIEIGSFFKRIKNQNKQKVEDYTLVYSNSIENPFSFFSYIVINKNRFSEAELHHILTHESIHVKQKHSFDVLLSKLYCAVFWVNPIIWMYRKAMLQNLEFIADNETFRQIENKYEYQKTLVKVVSHQHNLSITNQFYQSLIKKRIVMLHTNQSHKKNVWKYATILPLLVGFMLFFQIKTVAQVKEKAEIASYGVEVDYSHILTSKTTDSEIKEIEKSFKDEDSEFKINNIKRNKEGEITEVRMEFSSKNGSKYKNIKIVKGDRPIKPIRIFIKENKDNEKNVGFEEVSSVVSGKFNSNEVAGEVHIVNEGWTIDNMTKDGKKAVIILNGKIQSETEKIRIPLDQEIDIEKEISAKQVKEKYNLEVKEDGLYYEITTKKEVPTKEESKEENKEINTGWGISFETETSNPGNVIDDLKENTEINYKKALILFDGNEINFSELEKINPNKISSIISLTSTQKIIEKYGNKAIHGVILIESNENKKNNPIKIDEKKEVDFKINNDNDGFVISKNSNKEDFDFYEIILKKNNIIFEYSEIERNEKNQITSITIQLKENGKIEKKVIKSNTTIPKIFIGKRKGALIITETK